MSKAEIEKIIRKLEAGLAFYADNPEWDDCGWAKFTTESLLPSLKEELKTI